LVKADGIDITYLNLSVEEIFYRFTKFQEWDVSEMSFGKYASLLSQNSEAMSAIPVFPSRAFRLSSIYVRLDAGIKKPQDLAGKRVGIPEWAQTAAVYTRGYLMHDAGVPLSDIDWYQAGVNEPGRVEKVDLRLPQGVRYTSVPTRSLSEMLSAGELDAVMSARPPAAFLQRQPNIGRLFPDFITEEKAHWRKTGIFPIMHVVAIRRALLQRHPWLAMNLFKAFEEAKKRSLARVLDVTASQLPIPWGFEYAAQTQAMFGDDFWPYGIEPNRSTLTAFLRYAWEQGVCHRQLTAEELFPAEVQSSFRV
ncbi:MAG: 4,5-dihydroxyphthalate decarboxylase, partial [Burkholderiales bacterium]|nr:4,5-dihydroxyphthalate decarboxylase [Burkholderiales bacterium]